MIKAARLFRQLPRATIFPKTIRFISQYPDIPDREMLPEG